MPNIDAKNRCFGGYRRAPRSPTDHDPNIAFSRMDVRAQLQINVTSSELPSQSGPLAVEESR
jgi:hypothetical protein